MSDLNQDLIKIVVDKLLLGAIAAGFGFYLAKLLEDYRTKSAFRLAVLQQRIAACKELMSLVAINQSHVEKVWDVAHDC